MSIDSYEESFLKRKRFGFLVCRISNFYLVKVLKGIGWDTREFLVYLLAMIFIFSLFQSEAADFGL